MAKPESGKKKPWHPCDDCLDPLAKVFGQAVLAGAAAPSDVSQLNTLNRALDRHAFIYLIIWLKINISVDFAKDVETMVEDPLYEYAELLKTDYPTAELDKRFEEIWLKLSEASHELRVVSVFLRGKLANTPVDRAALPVDHGRMTELFTKKQLAAMWAIDRSRVDEEVRSQFHHIKICGKYSLPKTIMPPAYHSARK